MRDPLWARYYAAVDRLNEVGPVAEAKDGDLIALRPDQLQAMKAALTEIFAEMNAAMAAIEARGQGRENGRP